MRTNRDIGDQVFLHLFDSTPGDNCCFGPLFTNRDKHFGDVVTNQFNNNGVAGAMRLSAFAK